MAYFWLGVVVVAIIVEAATTALVSIWFIPSGIISMILAFCGAPIWVQILVFVAVSAVLLPVFHKIFKKKFAVKSEPTNADAVIGQSAVVTERISNIDECGAVKVMGKEWTARAEDADKTFEVGEVVTVCDIRGVKLICK